ncbi:MAG: Ig domain-containing protein, partial [Candidatus Poseidoniaceae archaeon]|nr:Ig domain-containing protein [Candidatus Poseidoniaceae archaeon]
MSNSTTTVYDSGTVGGYNSIVMDSNDKPHVVFYRSDTADLMYSTNASGSWVTTTVESSNNIGQYCNLAIDSNNGLHISYRSDTAGVRYAYKSSSSSTWAFTEVDGTGGDTTSIAIDSNDKPHIAYRDSGGDLGYAKKTGATWTSGNVQSAGNILSASIAIDSDNHIHVVYYDNSDNDMYHFTNTSGSWVRTMLEDIGPSTGGTGVDIAIDPTTDEPGISYFNKDNTSLNYTYYTGSTWSAAISVGLIDGEDYGRFNSIAYDSLGNVHISHERNVVDDLYYTSDKTGSWMTDAISTSNSVGTHTSIAVTSNDDVHIASRYNTGQYVYHSTVQGYNAGSVTRTGVTNAVCSVTPPTLPPGLSLTPGTCTLTGTPTQLASTATYNLTATSTTGLSKTGEFTIVVNDYAPVP